MTLRLEIYSGSKGYSELQEDWYKLFQSLKNRSYCQSPLLYEAYLAHLCKRPASCLFVAVYRLQNLVAVLPLESKVQRRMHCDIRILGFPEHAHLGLNDFVIDDEEDPAEIFTLVFESLSKNSEVKWDLIKLQAVKADSKAGQIFSGMFKNSFISRVGTASDVIKLGDAEVYFSGLSKNFRENLRKANNRIRKLGLIEFSSHLQGEGLVEGFREFLAVEASGWKGSEGTGSAIALNDELVSFYEQLLNGFSKDRQIEINLMSLDGKPIAGEFSIVIDSVVYSLKIAFDENYAKYQPGHLLREYMLKRQAETGLVKKVNLITNAKWHNSWKPEVVAGHNYFLFRASFKGYMLTTAMRLKILLSGS